MNKRFVKETIIALLFIALAFLSINNRLVINEHVKLTTNFIKLQNNANSKLADFLKIQIECNDDSMKKLKELEYRIRRLEISY